MKIGIDCRLYSPQHTGIGRYVYELVKNLIQIDSEHEYVLFFNQSGFEAFQPPHKCWKKVLADIPHYSLAEQTRFKKLIEAEKVDLMHFPHFNAPMGYKEPFVVTIHDLTLHYFPYKSYHPKPSLKQWLKSKAYRVLMRKVTQNAQSIITVSQHTKKDLIKEIGVSDDKVQVVYEGVPEEFSRASEGQIAAVKNKFSIKGPYLFYTGAWRVHKNLLRLLEGFREVKTTHPDLILVLGGKKDPAYPEISQTIAQLKLEDSVIMTDFLSDEDLIALFSGAEAFVFPSLYEGFGLPALEAMKLEVPVVSSTAASLPEVCGNAAEYCEAGDSQTIAKAIEKVLGDENRKVELIKAGKENLKKFSWKSMAKQILDIYKKEV